ncbi:MAG: sodium-translocating pyrophosphatase [Dehalococcoidia bacterium]|nr:sodium-translocating pyrophosphatase [Dehalococcoidia bacterium]
MDLVWIVPAAGILAIIFALWLARNVLNRDTGTPEMQAIADMIFEGSMAFLRRQYTTIAILALLTAVGVGLLVAVVSDGVRPSLYSDGTFTYGERAVSSTEEGLLTAIAFLAGAAASALSGYIGMYIAVRSNLRVASAAQRSLKEAITLGMRGGAVSGFLVVALSLLGVSSIFLVYSRVLGNPPSIAPFLVIGFAFGASFVALFAQIGGGIYTKAADVGADLVGKVEAGIPEDDPRNAAVVADLVGDNVGDCAGRGADIFESMAAESIGAMILGVSIYAATGKLEWIMLPLVVRAFGVIAAMVGVTAMPMFAKEQDFDHPMRPLDMGYYIVCGLSIIGLFIATKFMLGDVWQWFFYCGLVGIATGIAFVYITQYYTSGSWRPVKEIARASQTGPATNGIMGVSVGLETTAATAIVIGTALVASFVLASQADIPGIPGFTAGIFGTAVATEGMLMSAAYILAMDTFGPITDNAGGITEMSGAPASARRITDSLDTAGNTTKALTKGYAVGSAGLAAFLLFSAFLDKVKDRLGIPLVEELPIDISTVDVFVGGLMGMMLVFLFSALTIRAVGNAAEKIISEVRRQFREIPGIMTGETRPDYGQAVDITTRAALRQMVAPGILAIGLPIVVGLTFRFLRDAEVEIAGVSYPDSSGWLAVAGLLIVGTIGGILMATFLNNAGGAWDNAKKYIESGDMTDEHGNVIAKGSPTHAAAVVGDTIGDPFKDTAGPSLHVLIKLLATVTLVLAPLFVSS